MEEEKEKSYVDQKIDAERVTRERDELIKQELDDKRLRQSTNLGYLAKRIQSNYRIYRLVLELEFRVRVRRSNQSTQLDYLAKRIQSNLRIYRYELGLVLELGLGLELVLELGLW
jgi:hypothetical protein